MVGAIHSMYVYMYNTQVKSCLGVLKIMYILAQLNMHMDAYHLVFECPIFQPLRDKYHTLCSPRTSQCDPSLSRGIAWLFTSSFRTVLDMINA